MSFREEVWLLVIGNLMTALLAGVGAVVAARWLTGVAKGAEERISWRIQEDRDRLLAMQNVVTSLCRIDSAIAHIRFEERATKERREELLVALRVAMTDVVEAAHGSRIHFGDGPVLKFLDQAQGLADACDEIHNAPDGKAGVEAAKAATKHVEPLRRAFIQVSRALLKRGPGRSGVPDAGPSRGLRP